MADIITTRNTLHNVLTYEDGSNRTLTFGDPQDSLTTADVQAWVDYAVDNGLVQNELGSPLTGIKTSKLVGTTSTNLDLT